MSRPKKRLSRPEILRREGWEERSFNHFFQRHDKVITFANGKRVYFYAISRVERAERLWEWQVWSRRHSPAELPRWREYIADRAEIYVRARTKTTARLVDEAMEFAKAKRVARGEEVDGFTVANLSKNALEKVVTNYLRHHCTNYDYLCRELRPWSGGCTEEYRRLRLRVMDELKEAFPALSDVIDRQTIAWVVQQLVVLS